MGQGPSVPKKGNYVASLKQHCAAGTEFKDRVLALAATQDGAIIASAGASVLLWQVSTAKPIQELTVKGGPAECVALSADGEVVIAGVRGSRDLLMWRRSKGAHPYPLKGHTDRILCLGVLSDHSLVLSGSADSSINLWKLQPEGSVPAVLEGTLEGHEGAVLCLVTARDCSICVSGSADRTLKVWNMVSKTHLHTLSGHTDEVTAVAISPDGLNIVSGSADMSIRLWHRRSGKLKGELNAQQADVTALQFSHDGGLLLSGGADATVKLWSFSQGSLLETYEGHEDQISCIVTLPPSPSVVKVITGSWDETIKFWGLPQSGVPAPSSGSQPFSTGVSPSATASATAATASSSTSSPPSAVAAAAPALQPSCSSSEPTAG
eukprot:NODE_3036_length_1290_cov_58.967438_g2881_i0.p1 GENE.NODE_3036_length_1290_cov_58.967438_g2881_i0~~NODE_3036_length_1290_cov_58.967438_g2881_i0.p1  ORF type:complete len:398 (-),score=66.18 NODE_3036_length_1290_cov_58.967438_g2881_i0:97-1233(-)